MTMPCDDVTQEAPAVLDARGAITAERPWLSLTPVELRPTLPGLTTALIDLAVCARLDRERHAAYVDAAAAFGGELRAADRPLEELFTELHVLREAVWRRLEASAGAAERLGVILRVDVALGVGSRAALTGYFRAEHEAQGRWASTIAALETDSMHLLAAAGG
jgi:hypothetical protein